MLMFANSQIEQLDRTEMEKLQLERLKKEIRWVCSKSSFYQRKFAEAKVGVPNIKALSDIEKLPMTTKAELASVSAHELLTLPLSGILRISKHGSLARYTHMYTGQDVAKNVEMLTRILVAHGITNASTVGVLWDMSDSRILDVQCALEFIGAGVLLLGDDYDRADSLLREFKMDALISDFRQVTQLIVHLQAQENVDGMIGAVVDELNTADDFKVPLVLCFEENMHNPMRGYIERRLGAKVYSIFSSPELGCAGAMFPCRESSGLHVMEDYYYPEIIEYGGDKVIREAGAVGELVLTTLATEAMPIIRYRTGQTAMWIDDSCACGRSLRRIATPTEYYASF